MSPPTVRVYEVTFCSRVARWAEALFAAQAELGLARVEIEESTTPRRQRSDLRVYDAKGNLRLAGEVKLPGTPEGRTPFAAALIDEAFEKAAHAGAEFFFTWNVNEFVLFDAKLWQRPLLERLVKPYDLGLGLEDRQALDRPEVEARIREFLAEFFGEFAGILSGARPNWAAPLDELFVRAFNSHLEWPVKLTATHLGARAETDKAFDARLQDWMSREQEWPVIRRDVREWRTLLDRAARTLCYVFANRLLFYESVRTQTQTSCLAPLAIPEGVEGAQPLYAHFQQAFQAAVAATGDYETLFYPQEGGQDWAGAHVFGHADAADAWRAVLANLRPFDFQNIRSDVLGNIFRRLIAPEERHRYGQHYTSEDLVDVVNAFCIRQATDVVLDPACGSGSFLVRAYHRKAWLDPGQPHQTLLRGLFGVDIALFAAHLTTLNLAAREIRFEESYPQVRRGNFFQVLHAAHAGQPFCQTPVGVREDDGTRSAQGVPLPELDAVVGNPPYVRQELIPRRDPRAHQPPLSTKEELAALMARLWPGLQLNRRSDLHCYFWPAAAGLLKEGGWFGFLVSSSWLDVEYGFRLQEWVLRNFRLHAILESTAEPWFEDARIKTCAVILQRCSDAKVRAAQLVKFVRLEQPLAMLLGDRDTEATRQQAAERFRDAILRCRTNTSRPGLRIVVRTQQALWEEGLRAGRVFAEQRRRDLADGIAKINAGPDDDDDDADETTAYDEHGNGYLHEPTTEYGAGYGGGKWGKYLRAPDFYFEVMKKYGTAFVPLGELATIRFGIKSGCDDFFMPEDVTAEFLARYDRVNWINAPLHTSCKRAAAAAGRLRLVQAGDGTVHPIEAEYLAPEIHSLMAISRPVLKAAEVKRLVLLVSAPLDRLKGTLVAKYLRYGERATFASKKSKAIPVAKRSTCAGRTPWYDLTHNRRGAVVFAKGQQYRHIVLLNQQHLVVNCRLYDVFPDGGLPAAELLAAVANSTVVGFFKTFYGRYTGTEGGFELMISDLNLLELPDPRRASPGVAGRLRAAFAGLCERDTGELVEPEFKACHSFERAQKLAATPIALPPELRQPDRRALDLAVFELLGVTDAAERERLCGDLYRETAAHFRQIRIVELQKQEQRARTDDRAFRTDELAADLWDALAADERESLPDWLARQAGTALAVKVPEGTPRLPEAEDLFSATTVFFRQDTETRPLELPSRAHAELVYLLAATGLRGLLRLPADVGDAESLLARLRSRLATLSEQAARLARSRTGDEARADDVARLLEQWMIHGQPPRPAPPGAKAASRCACRRTP